MSERSPRNSGRFSKLAKGLALLGTIPLVLWSLMAIAIDASLPELWKILVLSVLAILTLLLLWYHWRSPAFLLWPLALFGFTLTWWLNLEPRNDRNWAPQYEKLCHVDVKGSILRFHNVRFFDYWKSESPAPQWQDRDYDLEELEGLNVYFSFWGPKLIAHTILSWDFKDASPLAISIETRREKGEPFSGLYGFFRQFELIYVVADERDLIALRTQRNKEEVFFYRLNVSPDLAKALLLEYVARINELESQPRWYNAFRQNCTTLIRDHLESIAGEQTWTWRLLFNGLLPRLAHQRKAFKGSTDFLEFQKQSLVSGRHYQEDVDFSDQVRGVSSNGEL